ncbi:MAG: zf-HC2 domain-containing protein [Elusimicrobia bacterium]|jgi:anti-sigma factor RsiW|nr:zf-HC2 domain-containing protein [Elusimicrobiota bacterium]
MTHEHVASDVLSAWVDGEVSEEEAHHVRTHVVHCADCQATLSDFKNVKSFVLSAQRRPLPEALRRTLETHDTPVPGVRRWGAFLFRPSVWAPASAIAAAALAFFLIRTPQESMVETLPLEVLMASHARYQSEGRVPRADLYQTQFTAHVAGEIVDE